MTECTYSFSLFVSSFHIVAKWKYNHRYEWNLTLAHPHLNLEPMKLGFLLSIFEACMLIRHKVTLSLKCDLFASWLFLYQQWRIAPHARFFFFLINVLFWLISGFINMKCEGFSDCLFFGMFVCFFPFGPLIPGRSWIKVSVVIFTQNVICVKSEPG